MSDKRLEGETALATTGALEQLREKAAQIADRYRTKAYEGCERLGFTDPTTGIAECGLEARGGCLCYERDEAGEDIAKAIRALPLPDSGSALVASPAERVVTLVAELRERKAWLVDRHRITDAVLMQRAADTLEAALVSPAQPEGWVLVPREPTWEMTVEGHTALDETEHTQTKALGSLMGRMAFIDVWKAMLAGAPKPGATPDAATCPYGKCTMGSFGGGDCRCADEGGDNAQGG